MKASLSWLQEHIDLSDLSTEEISERLTFAGIEVEGIEQIGVDDEHLVVGRIDSFSKHPNADKLSVCIVDTGEKEMRQIVCGAKNFSQGDHVPVALPGAVLPGDFKIKEGKLRGELSQGMMCAGEEIGIASSHDGLHLLEGGPKPGTKIASLFQPDTIFELEITPNRPDLLSYRGLARDLSTILERPLKESDKTTDITPAGTANGKNDLIIEAPEACSYYRLSTLGDVSVQSSPEWLTSRLQSIGLIPHNNVVDITNYLLFETGQPLHAFDAQKVSGPIRVRFATQGENFIALDDSEHELCAEDLVIADDEKVLALAGVMGGLSSAVDNNTTTLLLEVAHFNPSVIRASSQRHQLSSDSSYRFERGCDKSGVDSVSESACTFLTELAEAQLDQTVTSGNASVSPAEITLSHSYLNDLIGIEIDPATSSEILQRLGLTCLSQDDESSTWSTPSYRLDLSRPADLAEEIIRIHGIDDLPASLRGSYSLPSSSDKLFDYSRDLASKLAAQGFDECQTLKLISEDQLGLHLGSGLSPEGTIHLKRPMNDQQTALRPSLLPGLLATLEYNVRQSENQLRPYFFFEMGTIFCTPPHAKEGAPKIEKQNLGLLISGSCSPKSWKNDDESSLEISDLLDILQSLFPSASLSIEADSDDPESAYPLRSIISLRPVGGKPKKIGKIAVFSPSLSRTLGLSAQIAAAELDLTALHQLTSGPIVFSDLPRYPAMTRDISLQLKQSQAAGDLAHWFEKFEQPLLEQATLLDVFSDPSGEKLSVDDKALTWSLTYRHADRTLEQKEVDQAHEALLSALSKEMPVEIR